MKAQLLFQPAAYGEILAELIAPEVFKIIGEQRRIQRAGIMFVQAERLKHGHCQQNGNQAVKNDVHLTDNPLFEDCDAAQVADFIACFLSFQHSDQIFDQLVGRFVERYAFRQKTGIEIDPMWFFHCQL